MPPYPLVSFQPHVHLSVQDASPPIPKAHLPLLHPLPVQALLDSGADIDALDYVGCTALHHSISSFSMPSMCQLLARGASLTMRDNQGLTPLELAEHYGRPELVEIIKKAALKVSVPMNGLDQGGAQGRPPVCLPRNAVGRSKPSCPSLVHR